MSEQAAEAPARNPAKGDGKNIFTRKIGPLPMWAWLAISLAIILGWAYWQNKKNPAAQSGTANASQVPQFVNQTYTTVTPPVAPVPGKPPPDKDGKDKDGKGKGGGDHGGGSDGGDDDHKHRKRPRRRHHPTHGGDQASTAPVPAVAPSPPTAAPAPAVM